jgi:hypothetical protein
MCTMHPKPGKICVSLCDCAHSVHRSSLSRFTLLAELKRGVLIPVSKSKIQHLAREVGAQARLALSSSSPTNMILWPERLGYRHYLRAGRRPTREIGGNLGTIAFPSSTRASKEMDGRAFIWRRGRLGRETKRHLSRVTHLLCPIVTPRGNDVAKMAALAGSNQRPQRAPSKTRQARYVVSAPLRFDP